MKNKTLKIGERNEKWNKVLYGGEEYARKFSSYGQLYYEPVLWILNVIYVKKLRLFIIKVVWTKLWCEFYT